MIGEHLGRLALEAGPECLEDRLRRLAQPSSHRVGEGTGTLRWTIELDQIRSSTVHGMR